MPSIDASPLGRAAGVLMAVFAGGLVLVGCSGTGSKKESSYGRLVGSWTVERLEVDGFNRTNRIEERYESLTFRFRDNSEDRTYEVTGNVSSDSTRLMLQGQIDLLSSRVLRMLGGFPRPVTWTFQFETSNSVFMEIPDDRLSGSGAFLRDVLPATTWGDTPDVSLRLAREN